MTPRSSDRDAPPDAEPDRHVPRVLIVGGPDNIRWIWKTHLDQQGLEVHVAADEDAAIECLRRTDIDVIVLDVMLSHGVGFAVSDYAQFRRPDARVIFVTRDDFLSGGAIFQLSANACAAMLDQPLFRVAERVGRSAVRRDERVGQAKHVERGHTVDPKHTLDEVDRLQIADHSPDRGD